MHAERETEKDREIGLKVKEDKENIEGLKRQIDRQIDRQAGSHREKDKQNADSHSQRRCPNLF